MMKPKYYIGHLSALKRFDENAYDRFVEMLVEDCQAEFSIDEHGTLRCIDRPHPGLKVEFRWDPADTSSDMGWNYVSVEKTD